MNQRTKFKTGIYLINATLFAFQAGMWLVMENYGLAVLMLVCSVLWNAVAYCTVGSDPAVRPAGDQ